MISFIVIGHNEGWKLTKCFKSIFNFTSTNKIKDFEVIYVDSKSADDSIKRAKEFEDVRIYQITGMCNAAVGRNIGAKEAKGDILFFIDGDMEMQSDFFEVVFDESGKLCYPFISGGLVNFNYNSEWMLIKKETYGRNTNKDKLEHTTGGIFVIEKKLWDSVKGMNTKFMRNQDLDLGLRLSKEEFPLLRKKEIIAYHHTIPYGDKKRTWNLILNGSELYPMVLIRDHLFYFPAQKEFILANYTLLVLLTSVLIYMFTGIYDQFAFYILLLVYKSFNVVKKVNLDLLNNLLKYIFRDIVRFFGFFFFYPKSKELRYQKLL